MNFYAIGFCAVAVTAVGGADYFMQAKSSEMPLAEYGLSSYLKSYGTRFSDYRAQQDLAARQSELAKAHLPEAPNGWERRAWEPEPQNGDGQVREGMAADEEAAVLAMQGTFVGQMAMKDAMKKARAVSDQEVWEYVRGDTVIRLRARYTDPKVPLGGQEKIVLAAIGNMEAVTRSHGGYAVVQGVPYFSVSSAWSDLGAVKPDTGGAVQLRAYVGRDIRLWVHSTADPETLRALLEAIDYDGLNAMLDEPISGIGASAPVIPPELEAAIAQAAADAMASDAFTGTEQLKAAIVDAMHEIGGATAATGLNAEDADTRQSYLDVLDQYGISAPHRSTADPAATVQAAATDALAPAVDDASSEVLAGIMTRPRARPADFEARIAVQTQPAAPQEAAFGDTVAAPVATQPSIPVSGSASSAKPKRLQLSSEQPSRRGTCVGSFCD
ncbi:MAG: hypothetical protein AAF484_07075 [Pseudomonadota bacterium]